MHVSQYTLMLLTNIYTMCIKGRNICSIRKHVIFTNMKQGEWYVLMDLWVEWHQYVMLTAFHVSYLVILIYRVQYAEVILASTLLLLTSVKNVRSCEIMPHNICVCYPSSILEWHVCIYTCLPLWFIWINL